MGAEQLAEAEERPGGERPAPRRDDPALVGLAREHRAGREGERDRQADVAEVEHRRVGDHVGVLEARDEAGAVDARGSVTNGLATATSMKLKKVAIAADHRHDPDDDVAQQLPVER